VQSAVRLAAHWMPLPDLAVLRHRADYYASGKAGAADIPLSPPPPARVARERPELPRRDADGRRDPGPCASLRAASSMVCLHLRDRGEGSHPVAERKGPR
jgi:hypothetical protein